MKPQLLLTVVATVAVINDVFQPRVVMDLHMTT